MYAWYTLCANRRVLSKWVWIAIKYLASLWELNYRQAKWKQAQLVWNVLRVVPAKDKTVLEETDQLHCTSQESTLICAQAAVLMASPLPSTVGSILITALQSASLPFPFACLVLATVTYRLGCCICLLCHLCAPPFFSLNWFYISVM